jgi:hypothetical protein
LNYTVLKLLLFPQASRDFGHEYGSSHCGFKRTFHGAKCEDGTGCPFRTQCTEAKEGNQMKILVNESWEQQRKKIQQLLSVEKTGKESMVSVKWT